MLGSIYQKADLWAHISTCLFQHMCHFRKWAKSIGALEWLGRVDVDLTVWVARYLCTEVTWYDILHTKDCLCMPNYCVSL